jgi:hypothetical protein
MGLAVIDREEERRPRLDFQIRREAGRCGGLDGKDRPVLLTRKEYRPPRSMEAWIRTSSSEATT